MCRNPSSPAAQMRLATARDQLVRDLPDIAAALTLAAGVLDAWSAADAPTRALVRRYVPALGDALDALALGPGAATQGPR